MLGEDNLFPQTLEQKSQLGTIQDINIRQTISGDYSVETEESQVCK